jgi:serine/threonine-protein kinase
VGDTGRTLACPECRRPCLRGSKFCAHCGRSLTSRELGALDPDGEGALPPGTVVGSYRLLDVLGVGGMGRVYVAEHVKLGRRVAIKKLRRELVSNAGAVARFFAEARAVNRIFHENIVEITDVIEQPGGDNCIVMELLKGEDLAHRLHHARTLPLLRVCGIAAQIASALSAVHAAGMIHRDLKADNIFLIERGGNPDFVKVLDFGVAKLTGHDDRAGVSMHATAAGQVIGTLEYMSPEQARGEPVDFRADIYALGVIIYEMITGALPVQARSFAELMVKHATAPVELPGPQYGLAPGIQAGRDQLILEMLAKEPDARPSSMTDVERRLRDLVDAMMMGSRREQISPSPSPRAVAGAVAKVALVKRPTSQIVVEIATPRSVSRIDVLTPSSIGLGGLAKPLIPPPSPPPVEPPRPAGSGPLPSAERLARSSSDAHVTPARPAATERARSEPGRQAGAPITAVPDICASGTPASADATAPPVAAARPATVRSTGAAPVRAPRAARSPSASPDDPGSPASSPAAVAISTIRVLDDPPAPSLPAPLGARRSLALGAGLTAALAGVFVVFHLGSPLPATPAAQPPEVKLKFVSAPEGAEVRIAGSRELLGVTPFTRSFPRSERAAEFELLKPGFATVTQVVSLTGDDAVAVALSPVIAAPPAPQSPVAPPAVTPQSPVAPPAVAPPAVAPPGPVAPPVVADPPKPERPHPAAPPTRAAPPSSDRSLEQSDTVE